MELCLCASFLVKARSRLSNDELSLVWMAQGRGKARDVNDEMMKGYVGVR